MATAKLTRKSSWSWHFESIPESGASDEEPEEPLANDQEQLVNDEEVPCDEKVEELNRYEEAIAREGDVELQLLVCGTTTTPQVRPERRVQFDSTLEYTECCLSTAE